MYGCNLVDAERAQFLGDSSCWTMAKHADAGKWIGAARVKEGRTLIRTKFLIEVCMRKTIGERFEEMPRLYHFTSAKAAFSIIESGKLRFGKSFRLNDLIESNRIVFSHLLNGGGYCKDEKDAYAEDEMRRYQIISFAQDSDYNGHHYLGFDLHTMWGLYAEKGYGVCLVFDKDKLMLRDATDWGDDVRYFNSIPQDFEFANKSRAGLKNEIWRRRSEIFFNKRKEWEYEQEYRVIRRARGEMDLEYLDISDALSCAIICKDDSVMGMESMFESDLYHDLHYSFRRLPILTYEYGIDGYSLFEEYMNPIWTEQCGFM